jgi:hypothetical protein
VVLPFVSLFFLLPLFRSFTLFIPRSVLRTMQDKGIKFSEAVEQAVNQGFTEIDLREDLCGTDTARKVYLCTDLNNAYIFVLLY